MSNKQRYVVRDGYHFLYLSEIRDGEGKVQQFIPKEPAGPGTIVEIDPMQMLGQEHKLMRAEKISLKCNNTGCGKEFDTDVPNLAYAWCPHCGGRGGQVIGAIVGKRKTKKAEPKPEKKEEEVKQPEPEDDRMERSTTAKRGRKGRK
jgi:hypothetical protein